jgi:hypothetical protein
MFVQNTHIYMYIICIYIDLEQFARLLKPRKRKNLEKKYLRPRQYVFREASSPRLCVLEEPLEILSHCLGCPGNAVP